MRARILMAVLVLSGAVGLTRADDKPVDRAEVDKRVVAIVYESAVLGTDIFNKGAHGECARLYQGTLLAVVPMLDHRPKLQTNAKTRLARAAQMAKPADAAFELRTALDEIQNEIAPPKKEVKDPKDVPKDPKETKKLWDRLGGEVAVTKVVHEFVAAAAEDKKVNFLRDGKVKIDAKGIDHLKKMLVEQISEVSGGPLKYSGKNMKDVHKDMAITNDEFNALAGHLVDVLKKNKVAQADIDELLGIVEKTRADIVAKPKQ